MEAEKKEKSFRRKWMRKRRRAMEKHMVVKEESIRSSSGLNSCGLMMVERVKKRGGGGWV